MHFRPTDGACEQLTRCEVGVLETAAAADILNGQPWGYFNRGLIVALVAGRASTELSARIARGVIDGSSREGRFMTSDDLARFATVFRAPAPAARSPVPVHQRS